MHERGDYALTELGAVMLLAGVAGVAAAVGAVNVGVLVVRGVQTLVRAVRS